MMLNSYSLIAETVKTEVSRAKVFDMHTHVFAPCFGGLLLYGIDELLTYHYLVAETFRYTDMPYEQFWSMTKQQQADFVYDTLFVRHTPISEACRGVLTVINALGLKPGCPLDEIRAAQKGLSCGEYVDLMFEKAGVSQVVMTNDPFDDAEREVWLQGYKKDERFIPALRLDGLLLNYEANIPKLQQMGYSVNASIDDSAAELKRFLCDWVERMDAMYMAVSLPDTFRYPDKNDVCRIIDCAVIPAAKKMNVPFALMIGVKRQVNPQLKLAGDGVGKGDVDSVAALCEKYSDVKFLVTMLARENQHELCVAARKFRNLFVFGCWWFLNNPSLIEEMTRMRLEMLGTSMLPQHSDARVLDQIIYKWTHSKKVIAKVLTDKYYDLYDTGYELTPELIRRDVELLFGGSLKEFLKR